MPMKSFPVVSTPTIVTLEGRNLLVFPPEPGSKKPGAALGARKIAAVLRHAVEAKAFVESEAAKAAAKPVDPAVAAAAAEVETLKAQIAALMAGLSKATAPVAK